MTETPQSSSGQSRDEILARLEEIYANDPAVREHGVTLGEVAEGRVVLHRDVTADMVKPGAVVIDVGINRDANGKLVGDVEYERVREIASAVSPVPGGVGRMTVAMLVANTVLAAERLHA